MSTSNMKYTWWMDTNNRLAVCLQFVFYSKNLALEVLQQHVEVWHVVTQPWGGFYESQICHCFVLYFVRISSFYDVCCFPILIFWYASLACFANLHNHKGLVTTQHEGLLCNLNVNVKCKLPEAGACFCGGFLPVERKVSTPCCQVIS